jgi:hypothetical protein
MNLWQRAYSGGSLSISTMGTDKIFKETTYATEQQRMVNS